MKKVKIVVALLFAILSLLTFVGCGPFTCDYCHLEKEGSSHSVELITGGPELTVCDDCYSLLNSTGLIK